jgi:hypothetical protein
MEELMLEKKRPDLDPEEIAREEARELPDREEMSVMVPPTGMMPPTMVTPPGDPPQPLPPDVGSEVVPSSA